MDDLACSSRQISYQPRPAGLVGGAKAPACVSMVVLVEKNQILEMWIRLEQVVVCVDWALARCVFFE